MPAALKIADCDVVWAPQSGPQKAYFDCPLGEILFGGSRGGGKSDGILGKWGAKAHRYGAGFNAVFFRQEMPQQDDLTERGKEIYCPLGAEWIEYKKTFNFAGGGRLRFRPLESVSDANKYQGQNLSDAAVEEAGNYPSSQPIDMLHGAMRSVRGVPVQLTLTANPGGAGHQWIKRRYIDPAPTGMHVLARLLPDNTEHRYIYIPSRVQDNRALLARDPGYISRLHLVGSEALVKAWLSGDWNVVAGAFFDCWEGARHVIRPFDVPVHWMRFGSFDWGSARPFSMQWWAVSDGSALPDGRQYPTGAMILYREWYGASGPNEGLRLTTGEIAQGIKEREENERVDFRTADPACWKVDGGPSHAEIMMANGVAFRKADNSRIAGWTQLRDRLMGNDNIPMLYAFSTAVDTIRTIPALQHDTVRPEDVDSDAEDHAADSCFVAGTMIATANGQTAIEEIKVGELVHTRSGLRRVSAVFSVGERDVLRACFNDGKKLTGTANHPVWVEGRGFLPLNELRYADMMCPCPLPSSVRLSKSFRAVATTCVARITEATGSFFTGPYGARSMAQSPGAPTFTTEITTNPTIIQITSRAWRRRIIQPITANSEPASLRRFLSTLAQARLRGTGLPKVWRGIGCTIRSIAERVCTSAFRWYVRLVEPIMPALSIPGFAPTPANPSGVALNARTRWKEHASNVECLFAPTNTPTYSSAPTLARSPAATSALQSLVYAKDAVSNTSASPTVLSGAPFAVGEPAPAGRQKVYNLTVDEAEEYFANGILVHNCRYACMARPWTRKPSVVLPMRGIGQMTMGELWKLGKPAAQSGRI